MTPDELRTYCLGLNGASEDFPFNPEVSVFKVGGKLFA
ncbi:MAG: MmcQ/YjbR family DNA-binding protein, partial [Streptomyces sp.]